MGVYTTCPVIAKKIAERKSTVRLDVIFPSDYKDEDSFFNTEYLKKSMPLNTSIDSYDNSYEVLKENAINNEFESLSGCISGTNLMRYHNTNKVMFSQDEKEMLLPYDSFTQMVYVLGIKFGVIGGAYAEMIC